MRRLIPLLLCLLLLLTSCVKVTIIMPRDETSKNEPNQGNAPVTVPETSVTQTDTGEEQDPPSDSSVDFDFSTLSPIEQYDKVLEFVFFFDDYVGQTVKLHGQYTYTDYHVFTVADNLNCCYAPFEIITRDGVYPNHEDWVIIEGVLGYIEEDGEKYPYIDVYAVTPSEFRD